GIADESELFMWVRAVAIAVLAGVIAKIILFPPGTLASVPLVIRLCAIVGGFAAFLFVRRSVLAGVGAREGVLTVGALAFGILPSASPHGGRELLGLLGGYVRGPLSAGGARSHPP